MMLIPAIDLMDGQVVRLYRGDPSRKTVYHDDPVAMARLLEGDGADMLHVVDLDAALGMGSNAETVQKITRSVSIPVEAAGGLRTEQDALGMAETADRIVLGTMAFEEPDLLRGLCQAIGSERIVISVDHREGMVVTRGWRKDTGVQVEDAVGDFLSRGFTEFLLTDVDADGTMQGAELDHLGRVCAMQGTNVIASGGIAGEQDIKAVSMSAPYGVILGRALYEREITIDGARESWR